MPREVKVTATQLASKDQKDQSTPKRADLRRLSRANQCVGLDVWCNFDTCWYLAKIIKQSSEGIQVQFCEDGVLDEYSFKESEQDLWLVRHDAFVLQHYTTKTVDETLSEICLKLGAAGMCIMVDVNQRRYKSLSKSFRQFKGSLKFAKHTSLLVPVGTKSGLDDRWN